jgi:hypothetical protein
MLLLLQLLIAIFAIYSALRFEEETRLLVPLACLVAMLVISRIDRQRAEKAQARKVFLKAELDRMREKEAGQSKDQDFFLIESLLWPKSEILLIDAVHTIFRNLGFKVTTGADYGTIDRILRIPRSGSTFGLEILMTERGVEGNHAKLQRALQFERGKKEGERTLIIGSTYVHHPLSERERMSDVTPEAMDFLTRHRLIFLSAHQLYQLWQRAKEGSLDVFEVFQRVHSHPGGIFTLKGF